MAYIEAHQSLRDHRKILALAGELGLPEPHVAGHCLYLWLWSLDNAQDGALPDGPGAARVIERAAGWTGAPGQLVAALQTVGLLDRLEDGRLVIHDWWEYCGRLMEQRRSNAARQQRYRDRNGPVTPHHTSTAQHVTHPADTDTASHNANVTVMSPLRNRSPYPTVPNHHVTPEDELSHHQGGAGESPAPPGDDNPASQPPDPLAPLAPHKRPPEPLAADHEAVLLARDLRDAILASKPDARVPKTLQQLQPWARDLDLMLRIDQRAPPDIRAVIAFAQTHRFWRSVIMSAGKLRDKFDQLQLQMQQDQGGQHDATTASAADGTPGRRAGPRPAGRSGQAHLAARALGNGRATHPALSEDYYAQAEQRAAAGPGQW